MSPSALVDCLKDVPDSRRDNKNKIHSLHNILTIAFCGIMCGSDTFTEMEEFGEAKKSLLEEFLDLSNGIPSHDTFGRVFAQLSTHALMQALTNWLDLCREAPPLAGRTVAIDGKAMRGAGGANEKVHIVGAWVTEHGLALAQQTVNQKSNEIEAIPHLLDMLELQGAVVTIDAAGCQKNIAAKIIDKEADFVLALKPNHPTLYEEVNDCFLNALDFGDPTMRHIRRCESSHGRDEIRDFYVLAVPETLYELDCWVGLQSLGMVMRESIDQKTGESQFDIRFYLCSLPPQVQKFAHASRSHWGIENGLHWVLDVAFHEDACKIQNPRAASNLSALCRLALSTFRSHPRLKRGIATQRKVMGWNDENLRELLTLATKP